MKSVIILAFVLLLQIISVFAQADAASNDDINVDYKSSPCTYTITVDYIVVGGGAAGAVAAARLSENPNNTVLLLDGGARSQTSVGGTDYVAARYKFDANGNAIFNTPLTRYDVPAFSYSAVSDYPGSPTPAYPVETSYAGVLKTDSKILGGKSVHNYMVWDRLTPYSINSWNVSGWTYQDALPYWKKSEDTTNLGLTNAGHRGTNGPIKVNYAQAPDPVGDVFLKSCASEGLGVQKELNDPVNHVGCGNPTFNINNEGIRSSSVNEYLAPALSRKNLKVRVNTIVVQVLFNNQAVPKAIGVKYMRGNVTYTAMARKEIVLSAGAIGTSKILLLSGVGPAAHLNSLNIPVVANLPVGKRMALHPVVFAYYKYNVTAFNPYNSAGFATEYATQGTGVFASTGVPAEAKLKSKPSVPDFDINVLLSLGGYNQPGVIQFASLLWGSKQNNGTITLKSKDPNQPAVFTYTPYANADDVYALVQTLKYFRRIATAAPSRGIIGDEVMPGPSYTTDEHLRNYVFNGGSFPTITHLHGGAVLGNTNDPNSVLDPRMRVKKVQGLRVADASIVPGIFLAGPMANIVMFGERVAAFILADNL